MGKNKNKNKNKSNIVFDSDEENDKKQLLSNLDNNDDFQPVKKGAKINMFQMLQQENDSEEENLEKSKEKIKDKDTESFEEVFSEKGITQTESVEEVLSVKLNQNISNKELFKMAFDEDLKGNQSKAIEYYTILIQCPHKVSYHNLAHIYWEQNKLELALNLFEKAIKLKYLNSFYDYAVLVSENLDIFSKYKTTALEYFKIYMHLKNATQDEKEIYFDLIKID